MRACALRRVWSRRNQTTPIRTPNIVCRVPEHASWVGNSVFDQVEEGERDWLLLG